MRTKEAADKLRDAGIPVLSYSIGNSWRNGEVHITDDITLQVSIHSKDMHVIQRVGKKYKFYPDTSIFATVVKHIYTAMALETEDMI